MASSMRSISRRRSVRECGGAGIRCWTTDERTSEDTGRGGNRRTFLLFCHSPIVVRKTIDSEAATATFGEPVRAAPDTLVFAAASAVDAASEWGRETLMAELQAVIGRAVPDRVREADHPHSPVVHFSADQPLRLDAGVALSPFQVAYQTYGTLNAERSNAVLICHALTGDQHVFNRHPVTGKPGWWDTMVGPGKPIDTERYYVICPNVLGACMGTTGPASTDPKSGAPWGLDFPVITIRDMVRTQAMLLDRLGIDTLFAVAGGSMGGMQVLQWAANTRCG